MNEERKDPKKSWLSEHDNMQEELLGLKSEFAKKEGPEPKAEEPVRVEEVPEIRPDPTPAPPQKELTIRQMLGGDEQETPDMTDHLDRKGPPPTIAPGTIPKHPELSSYIAKVMQHENKLKRRKFEREKHGRPRSEPIEQIPEPPIPPKGIARVVEQHGSKLRYDDDGVRLPEHSPDFVSEGMGPTTPRKSGSEKPDEIEDNEDPEPEFEEATWEEEGPAVIHEKRTHRHGGAEVRSKRENTDEIRSEDGGLLGNLRKLLKKI